MLETKKISGSKLTNNCRKKTRNDLCNSFTGKVQPFKLKNNKQIERIKVTTVTVTESLNKLGTQEASLLNH